MVDGWGSRLKVNVCLKQSGSYKCYPANLTGQSHDRQMRKATESWNIAQCWSVSPWRHLWCCTWLYPQNVVLVILVFTTGMRGDVDSSLWCQSNALLMIWYAKPLHLSIFFKNRQIRLGYVINNIRIWKQTNTYFTMTPRNQRTHYTAQCNE